MNYLLADCLIRIKNAASARRREVVLPYSKFTKEIARLLKAEGFLTDVQEKTEGNKKSLHAGIAYDKRMPVFTDVTILSKPSLRNYVRKSDQNNLQGRGLGIIVVSTSQGVMTGRQALKKGIGGEVLFKIW